MQDVLFAHRKIVEDTVNHEQCNITGILMGQGNSILHLLEGPCYSVLHILDMLSTHPHFSELGIQTGRIVYNVEDRPQRLYPEWYSCTIQERKSQVEELTSENCIDIVHDLATGLLEVGKGLQTEAQEEVELNRYADHLPGKNLILALANSNDFFLLEEYVELYSESYHLELESDQTWPLDPLSANNLSNTLRYRLTSKRLNNN
eukprot:gene13741-29223_t